MTHWLRRSLKKPISSADSLTIQKTGEFEERSQADKAVIAQLASLGADVEQPREVNHHLYFGDEGAARTVEDLLLEQGFAAEKRPAAAGPKKWCVFASHAIVVSPQDMDSLATNLERLAKDHSGEYDGWEAALKNE